MITMKLPPLPLALPAPAAPHDRAIWLTMNVISADGCFHEVETYEGFAEWNETNQDWHDRSGMSIRGDYHATYNVLGWRELSARAAEATEAETVVNGDAQFITSEGMRETGREGWFAFFRVWHRDTGIQLIDKSSENPHPTRQLALFELHDWIMGVALYYPDLTRQAPPGAAPATSAAPQSGKDDRIAA